ncbi:alpha/beta hydrolase [Sphingomonas canadensis]|uniref:Alpha/beta hydrolase n=1 Tax=Sphingomonas canadensis TaxID=1219257 RepID=A0ABW3HF64_9SPHN|nr:alpha/beta hydrolase [Sphingomonas canadensis]MCW3837651.1 alpha/beta hydrolase [Sphingomonas canadensis]
MAGKVRFLRAGFDRRGFLAAASAALAVSPARAQEYPVLPPIPDVWRDAEVLPLWPDGPPSGGFAAKPVPKDWPAPWLRNVERPELHVFRPKRPNGRALLSIPGGAYIFVSILNEGVDVAREMTARGYTVFVLTYRLPGEGWRDRADVPLQDAQRAMRLIRANAARYGIDPAAVAAVGFSAGGHLGASLATGFAERLHAPRDAVDAIDARPTAMGLVYPVISAEAPVTHAESARQLLGENPPADLIDRRSPARHVTAQTPPVFLAHCQDDTAVPVENSLLMMRALKAAGRPVEVHLFEEGGHGFGVGPADRPWGQWLPQFALWLDRHLPGPR